MVLVSQTAGLPSWDRVWMSYDDIMNGEAESTAAATEGDDEDDSMSMDYSMGDDSSKDYSMGGSMGDEDDSMSMDYSMGDDSSKDYSMGGSMGDEDDSMSMDY